MVLPTPPGTQSNGQVSRAVTSWRPDRDKRKPLRVIDWDINQILVRTDNRAMWDNTSLAGTKLRARPTRRKNRVQNEKKLSFLKFLCVCVGGGVCACMTLKNYFICLLMFGFNVIAVQLHTIDIHVAVCVFKWPSVYGRGSYNEFVVSRYNLSRKS